MPDDSSSDAQENGRSFWSGLRTLLFGEEGETSLRDQIEEAIENHEGEVPRVGDLSPVERQMLRNLLHFGESTAGDIAVPRGDRSEEHTSELQSLMRISYAVFCLKKKNMKQKFPHDH